MKFVFVVGGSYKSFYLNKLKYIKKINLLVFYKDIFYDFDCSKENLFTGLVTNELLMLNKILKCPILVYGTYIKNNVRKKCFILCVNGKVSIINSDKDIYLYIKGKFILIGNKLYKYSNAFATISIIDQEKYLQEFNKINVKNHLICYPKGVLSICNNKIHKKIRKCCYFTLRFNKKMI